VPGEHIDQLVIFNSIDNFIRIDRFLAQCCNQGIRTLRISPEVLQGFEFDSQLR